MKEKRKIILYIAQSLDENVEYYNGDINVLVQKLKNEKGKNIFIDGGAEVIRAFRNEDLIDEYVISIVPVLIGKGIRLFKDTNSESRLMLMQSKVYDSGLVQLRYERAE